MNARFQILFVICLIFPSVIRILDSDLRALAMIRLLLLLFYFLILLCHILPYFLHMFLLLRPPHYSLSLYILLLTPWSKFLTENRTVAHLIKIFYDFYGN